MRNVYYYADFQTPEGISIGNLVENPVSVEYARTVNSVGELTMEFMSSDIVQQLRRNTRIMLYRVDASGAPRLAGETVWFLKKIVERPALGTVSIQASDALSILERRLVAYTDETFYADKTQQRLDIDYGGYFPPEELLRIDNMMRAYVRENVGALALDAARDLSAWIEVEPDKGLSPYGEKKAAWANLLSTLQDLAKMSESLGVPVFFDLVPRANKFVFRVTDQVSGVDRTTDGGSQLVFSDDLGNVTDIELTYDYGEERNVIYALGYDTGASQMIHVEYDWESVQSDPFGRSEVTVSVPDGEDSYLEKQAQAALYGYKSKIYLEARAVDTPTCIYGKDYAFGDKVLVATKGLTFDCHISTIRASYDNGEESLDVRLNGMKSA